MSDERKPLKFNRSKEWWMNKIKNEPDVIIGAGAYCAKPTLRQRICWLLGLHRKHDETLFEWRTMDPPEKGFAPSCLHTETHCVLDWRDRLRVLLTGHVLVDVWTKTDVEVKKSYSRSQIAVLPPLRVSELRQDAP